MGNVVPRHVPGVSPRGRCICQALGLGRALCLLFCLTWAGSAWAADQVAGGAANPAAERARIAEQRKAVNSRYAEAEQACAQQFQVNDCLAPARLARRQALEKLRAEQLTLDESARRQRAADRLEAQARKRAQAEARASAPRPAPPVSARQRAAKPASAASARQAERQRMPSPGPAAAAATSPGASASRSAQAAPVRSKADAQRSQAAQAYAQRQQAAASHAEAVARRNAERDKHRAPAAGLPVPAASAASRLNPASGR